MAPIIHCVRHAQGFHNISAAGQYLVDPILTPLGEEQCLIQSAAFAGHNRISFVIASPLKRTIHTALLTFSPALANGHCHPLIIALPEAQETTDLPCNTGSDPDVLKNACQEQRWPADLRLVLDGWNNKRAGTKWEPSADAISRRAREARRFIRDKVRELQKQGEDSPEVVLVTHGGYLHYFTEDWEDSCLYHGKCRATALSFLVVLLNPPPNHHHPFCILQLIT